MEDSLQTTKKIEIVIDAAHANRLLDALRQAGAPGYTAVHAATDFGDRGGDSLDDGNSNCYVMIACPPDLIQPLNDAVAPLLKRFGGVFLVTDCQWLKQ